MTPAPIQIDRTMFDGESPFASPAADEALARLPARRGLALLLAEGDRPVLLLPAADLRARVTGRLKNPDEQERRRLPDLQAITRTILWGLATSHFESDLRFLEIARRLWSDTYTEMLAWKPAWFLRVDLSADYPFFARTQDVRGETVLRPEGVLRGEGVSPLRPEGILPSVVSSSSLVSVPSSAHPGIVPSAPDAAQPQPHVVPTAASPIRYFGPFPSGSAAQRFIDGLADAFDLCRDPRCLRQAPRGRRCSYGQMGKCLCPCDGSISAAEYARVVTEAADFVAGARRPLAERLREEMKQSAAGLQFERAGALRAKLQRLAELEGADYAFVAPIEAFRFLLIQRGQGRREKKLSAFLADCAAIRSAGPVEYPLKADQLQKLVAAAMGSRACNLAPQGRVARGESVEIPPAIPARRDTLDGSPASPPSADPSTALGVDRWAMGLVAHYLFAGPRRRGVIVPVRADLTADQLAAEIEKSGEALGLKKTPKGPIEG